jgi:hypothetical protein
MIIAGGSAIPRIIDFARFARSPTAWAPTCWWTWRISPGSSPAAIPSRFPHAHVATTTTHKTLRGPRGGMILTNDEELAKKVNSAIFPGIQGGPLMHVIAAKAVAFGEALRPEFKEYQAQVIANAQALADQPMKGGLDIVTGGTDTHLMLVDLRPKGVKGNATEKALGRAHITCNKNGIPFDTEKPTITSVCASVRPRAPRAASARRSSARSVTGSSRSSSVPFDRERLARSITIALRKRPVDREQIDQMVSGILRKLESAGEPEVASNDVGNWRWKRCAWSIRSAMSVSPACTRISVIRAILRSS